MTRTYGPSMVRNTAEVLRRGDPERARKAISQDILIGGKALLDELQR